MFDKKVHCIFLVGITSTGAGVSDVRKNLRGSFNTTLKVAASEHVGKVFPA